MPDHLRQQIREEVATTVTGLTTTGANVFQSRVYRLSPGSLPAIVVFTTRERSEPDTMEEDNGLERTLSLVIEGYAKPDAEVDDVLDTIAKEVEQAMGADRTLNGLALDCFLTQTNSDLYGEGDKIAGVVQLTYQVEYRTEITAPDAVY